MNKWIHFYYYATCFRSFFGRNWRLKNAFRNYLTFRREKFIHFISFFFGGCWSLKPRTSNLRVLRTTVCKKTIAKEILNFHNCFNQSQNSSWILPVIYFVVEIVVEKVTVLVGFLADCRTKILKVKLFDFNVWVLKFLLFCLGSITNTMKRSYGSDTFKTSNSFLHDTSKGGLISKYFSFWLKSSQKMCQITILSIFSLDR